MSQPIFPPNSMIFGPIDTSKFNLNRQLDAVTKHPKSCEAAYRCWSGGLTRSPKSILELLPAAATTLKSVGKPEKSPASGVSYGDTLRGVFRILTGKVSAENVLDSAEKAL